MQEYGRRKRQLPAPPSVVWEDLVAPRDEGSRAWLRLRPDEVHPRILESEEHTRVVWSSLWPTRPKDVLVLELSAEGGSTALEFTLLGHGDLPDESRTGHIRKRVNEILYADLRFSYGQ